MRGRSRWFPAIAVIAIAMSGPGCASMRRLHIDRDLRPCSDGFAETEDGWKLGLRHYRPDRPDPGKDPVVLSHGLGLNGTFWTLTERHLPGALADAGYDVFVVDMRGSGASHRLGAIGWVNAGLRQTVLPELRSDEWTMDDQARYDVPAVLDYIERQTGATRVNWIGHSLGGMLMYAHLEESPRPERIGTFVAMGAPACVAESPYRTQMLRANRGIRMLLRALSTGRIARPLAIARPGWLARVDRFYYTAGNVERETINRFYGSTLEDPGPGALDQLGRYLATGRLASADGRRDYYAGLGSIRTPTLFVAGDGDILADLYSMWKTYEELGSPDKTFLRFGVKEGHVADYGHCDLVWSQHAPDEIFPAIRRWLDARQGIEPSTPQASPTPQNDPASGA